MYKMIFFSTMIMGTIISISSLSWFSMWMGLEINLLSIIPLFNNQKNMFSSESSLKYFITQALASLILLMSVILMLLMNEFISPTMNSQLTIMLDSALLTKLGAAPFHFWFPEVMEGLNWLNCMILSTWQKLAPMILLMNTEMNSKFLITIITMCLMVSTIMGFNQISLRKILAFSSINHIAWMLSATLVSMSIWMIYFVIYCLININIMVMFHWTKSYYLNQISNIMNKNKTVKFTFMMNFLSLGGLPPFIGFMPKWFVINWMVSNNLFTMTFMLIITTLIMLYIYMRIAFSSMTLSFNEPKTMPIKFKNSMLISLNVATLSSLILSTLMFNLI